MSWLSKCVHKICKKFSFKELKAKATVMFDGAEKIGFLDSFIYHDNCAFG